MPSRSAKGYTMSTEQAPPFLVDAVRASASKMQGMKAALDARAKELDALKAQLDSERQDLEKRAARLEGERRAIEGEGEEVRAARASVDQDLATIRADRENLLAEQTRSQDAANDLAARVKALREAESNVERLDHEMIGRMREAEAKFLAIVNREEELVKLQQDWLVAFETREQELRTITEQMHAQQEESAELHGSLAHLGSVFKDETDRLAAKRHELAAKEESLLEAQRYLATVIEAADVGPREAERPSPPPADEPPAPTESPSPPMPIVAPTGPEPVEAENSPEPEARPAVTRAEAMDRLTRAIEAWKRARDSGRNVGEMRNALKLAKDAVQAGKYESAIRLATEVLDDLQPAGIARQPGPDPKGRPGLAKIAFLTVAYKTTVLGVVITGSLRRSRARRPAEGGIMLTVQYRDSLGPPVA